MMRIAITGPESTGKTTLCQKLAKHYDANWTPEYARLYLEKRNGKYEKSDLDIIAQGQFNLWENHSEETLVFYDTEMTVLKIWSNYKYREVSNLILDLLNKQKIDHYLLCYPDIPWQQDPLREHANKREELFRLYEAELVKNNFPYTIVKGEGVARMKKAIQVVDDLLKSQIQIKS